MTATAFADVDASLKEIYSEDHRKSLAYVDNVLLATVGKEQSGGDYFVQAVRTRAPGGSSATYSKAKANNTASKIFKMNISRADLYQRVAINLNLFTAAKKSSESIYQITKEFDDGMKELGSKIERRLYRGKSGKIGQVASTTTVTGTTIVLTDKADAFNFQPGDKIQLSTADGGGAVRTGGTLSGILTVLSVDEQAGTVTTAGTTTINVAPVNDAPVTSSTTICFNPCLPWARAKVVAAGPFFIESRFVAGRPSDWTAQEHQASEMPL